MSDNFASHSGSNGQPRDHGDEDENNRIPRTNGDDEKTKNNPWKPISSSENNVLEADAWPEPSVGEQRRAINARPADEKPKRKIKWQNFDDDGASCGFTRGRGRYSGGSFVTPYGTTNAINSFRRGSGGYRPRGIEYSRGRGNYFNRNPNRIFAVRPTAEIRDERYANSEAFANHVCDVTRTVEKVAELSISSDVASDDARESVACSSNGTSTEVSDVTQNSKCPAQTTVNHTGKRQYRDRNSSVLTSVSHVPTQTYEAGPIGRARRSYLRQQPYQGDHEMALQHSLMSMTSIGSLLPFQTMSPITCLIPGVGGTVLGTANMPLTSTLPATLPVPSDTAEPPTSQPTNTSLPLSNAPTTNNQLPLAEVIPDHTAAHAPLSVHRYPAPLSVGMTSDVHAEVVDVNQMVTFINSVGWNNVIFPAYIREHPPVAAAIRSLAVTDSVPVDVRSESSSDSTSVATTFGDEASTKPVGKPDDVIVVENRVFFVPRNVTRSKFLKFYSKLDYIRHHLEYYFSDSNLQRDVHLVSILTSNQNVCPIAELLHFNRLRWVNTTESELLDAVSQSSLLAVTSSTDGIPFGVARITPVEAFTPSEQSVLPVTAVSSDVGSPNVDTVADPSVAISVSTTVASTSQPVLLPTPISLSISNTNGAGVPPSLPVGLQSPHQLPFIQPQSYLPVPRMELPSPMMNVPYTAMPNTHLSQSHLTANTIPPHFYTNQSDLAIVSHSSGYNAASQNMNLHQPGGFFAGTSRAAANAYIGGVPSGYLAVSPNVPGLQTISPDPNAASFMTALYRFNAPGSIPANVAGTYLSSIGNNGNAVPGFPNQQGSGSTLFLQLIPGVTHPVPTGTNVAGNYYSGCQTPGVSGPPYFNRHLPNAINPGNVWIPFGTAGSQNVNSATSVVQGSHSSTGLQSILAFPPTGVTTANIPLPTTPTSANITMYPAVLSNAPIPGNAFSLVPNPATEGCISLNANPTMGGGTSTSGAGSSEPKPSGHQRPVNAANNVYLIPNSNPMSSNHHSGSSGGSVISSGQSHSLSDSGNGLTNSNRASVNGNDNDTAHTNHS